MTEDDGEIQTLIHVLSGDIKRLSTVFISTVPGTALGKS